MRKKKEDAPIGAPIHDDGDDEELPPIGDPIHNGEPALMQSYDTGSDGEFDDLVSLRDDVIEAINDGLGYRASTSNLDDLLSHPRWKIPTGLTLLDYAIGGGIFEGKVMRTYGPPGAGKSTLIIHMILQIMSVGGIVVLHDVEETFDHDRAQKLAAASGRKWRPELLVLNEPSNLDDMFSSTHSALQTYHPVKLKYSERPTFDRPLVVFVDTISECPTKEEHEAAEAAAGLRKKKDVSKAGMSNRARYIKTEMRKLGKPLALHGASMVIVEQAIAEIGSYVPGFTTSGGKGVPFKASQSFLTLPSSAITNDDGDTGQLVMFKTDKTRFSPPKAKFKIPLYYNYGFHEAESLFLFLKDCGGIERKGPSYSFQLLGETVSFQKKDLVCRKPDPVLLQKVQARTAQVIDNLWTKAGGASDGDDFE